MSVDRSASKGSADDSSRLASLSEHIGQNIESIVALQRREWETVSPLQRAVESAGRRLGKPLYLVALVVAVSAWVVANLIPGANGRWDPPPFELLDGAMTFVSLVTTTIVLIAQNRQTKLEQQHTHLALQVSLLTEQKVSKLITLMEELRRDLPMVKDRHDPHAEVLQESADTAKLAAALAEGGAISSANDMLPRELNADV